MSGAGFKIVYKIAYHPANHFVVPAATKKPDGSEGLPYFNIVEDSTRRLVAMAIVENDAQTICLALDLLTATVRGDRTRLRELARLVDALKTGFN